MTPLFTPNQEMFFVILTMVFISAIIGDFSKARFFRSYKNTPSPWKDLSKDMKLFFLLMAAFMTWAQSKDSMQSGNGDWLSGEALEAIESEYYYSLPEEESGIAWALLTGNPPFTSNAVLTASQFQAGFACVSVTAIQPSALAAPANAVTFTNWPYAVARQAALLPQGCLPQGFTFGGRTVTNLYMAASGMLSFDGPKSSPVPATNGIPDGTALNYISVLQTPSDIVPTNGLFWYVAGTNSSVFTWKDVFLGQDINCLATVQAELYANGDFTCRYSFPSPTYSYSSIPEGLLIGAQNNPGGETVLHTNNLLAVHSAFMSAFELRWKSLAGLNPAVSDHDTDSLTTADELFIHSTDPRNRDSDGDALTDGEEVSLYATNPNALSSDASGQGDLWRILGGLGPSDAPYTNSAPSASEGILTVTTLLENSPTNGAAILRIGDQYIPVLAGTTLVSRIAIPRNATNLFILARGVNCDNAIAQVTLEASTFTKIRDPSGVFSGPFALSPSCVTASGEVLMPAYTLTPPVVCFHCPTSAVIRVTSSDPDVWLATEYGMLRDYAPQPFGYPETFTNGLIPLTLASMDSTLFIRAASTNIPAHFCNLHGQENDEYPSGQSYTDWCRFENGVHVHASGFSETNCPCLVFTNAFECPCSGDGSKPCTCAHAVSDPKAMPQDGSATNVLGHAALVIGGTNDLLDVTVPEGTYRPCLLCGCASGVPSSADVYRQTSCIEVTPGSLTADGAFSVAGISPSTNFADTVFMYSITDYSGGEAVTSYTRKDYTVLGTAVYPTDPGHSVSNWFIGCNVTNTLTLRTRVGLPSGSGQVTLSVTVESGTPAPLLYVYNRVSQRSDLLVTQWMPTFTQNLGDWRNAYCDTNGYAQVYLLCASGGVARVSHSFGTYSGQPYTLSCSAEQRFTAVKLAKLPLGSSSCFNEFTVGKVYVPTKWGGKLKLEDTQCELFYTDGSDLDDVTARKIVNGELDANRVAQGFPFEYVVPTNQFKWFYFRVVQSYNHETKATFTQSKTVSKAPWTCPWYPMADEQSPNLYDAGGALEIYDAAFNSAALAVEKRNLVICADGHYANSNLLLEADAERTIGYDFNNADNDNNVWTGWDPFVNVNVWASGNSLDVSWFGHCDIASAAIICEDEPATTYTVPNTAYSFSPELKKGLLVALYHGFVEDPASGYDVRPHLWHSLMEEQILGNDKMFACDVYNDNTVTGRDKVWNYPIYEITEAEYSEKTGQTDEKDVEIKCQVKYWSGGSVSLYYWYALTYNNIGTASESSPSGWKLNDPRAPDEYHRTPDRVWVPQTMTSAGDYWQGNLDYTTIRTIVPLSTP